jgi:hypothetical protein
VAQPAGIIVAGQEHEGTTYFRCGGCGAATRFAHLEQQYGHLVLGFLDQHGRCGNAVEIAVGRADLGAQ